MGAPRWCRVSAAVADYRCDDTGAGVLLDVVHPLVMGDVSLRRSCQADDGGGETSGDHAGKTKLLHVEALRLGVRAVAWESRFGRLSTGSGDSYPV